jgi:two-component system, chemotaxis family, sensor kinase CheA
MSEDLVKEFLIESLENLDRLDRDLVDLEKDPRNADTLGSVFRTIHTIKGTCGFLAFSKLERISHVGESLLSKMRDGDLLLNAEITTGLLAMVDAIRQILARIEETGAEGDQEYADLVAELKRLNEGGAARVPPAATSSAAPTTMHPPVATSPVVPAAVAASPAPPVAPVAMQTAPAMAAAEANSANPLAEGAAGPADAATHPHDPADDRRSSEDRRTGDDRRGGAADSSLRIDVVLLDKLMNLVGELVLARNQILQFTATQTDNSFVGATQRLNLVTSELQEGVMKTRMQPIGNVWSKFPRIVRDLAVQCDKQVRIEMEGKETELDKTIIEAIKDPLTHVVRNSVDHGVEMPQVRMQRGKPAEGHIRLRAFHEGGQINIEISDDGAGIDPARIRNKAVQRGVVSAEQAGRMTDHEVLRLVFLPGFSTAEKVSNISGRGVGMDVVKTNIEKIGGQVDIQSTIGEGTTLKIKIPLTLAIIPALMVAGGDGERYAIPQVSLLELVRLEGAQAKAGIERIQGAPFYRLRGNLLPLVDLDAAFQRTGRKASSNDVVNIVVLKADDRQFGLVVDAIHDTEEIVVKPLGKQLKGVESFAGATIMGDGRVALILDVLGIAQRARVVSEVRDRRLADSEAGEASADASQNLQTLLVCRVGASDRMAIPLSLVARLEEFSAADIERSGDQEVVQYRGQIMPLLDLAKVFTGQPTGHGDMRQVVVYAEGGRSVGLVVSQILDIVSERIDIQRRVSRAGVLGSVVLQQRVTELIDIAAVVAANGLITSPHDDTVHVAGVAA